jgi:hypothetical protein
MTNLIYLSISLTNIHELPPNTLNNTNLCSLIIFDLNIINNYSYNLLKNFGENNNSIKCDRKIELSGNFNFIPSHAFVIESHNEDVDLSITFGYSKINGSSFELGAFINAGRTLHLSFEGTFELTYLDEKIFKPLLDAYPKSTISLEDCLLDCGNCNFLWIFETKNITLQQITGTNCYNGKSLENLTIDDFKYCNCMVFILNQNFYCFK